MCVAEPRLQATRKFLVDQDGIQVHRGFGNANALAARGNAGMQVGQRLRVIEPFGLRHKAVDQRQHAVGPVDESGERGPPVGAVAVPPLIEPGLCASGILGRRQPDEREEIPALEMRAFLLELRAAFRIHQRGGRVRKLTLRIAIGGLALRLDENRPAGTEAAQRVVEAAGNGYQFGRGR